MSLHVLSRMVFLNFTFLDLETMKILQHDKYKFHNIILMYFIYVLYDVFHMIGSGAVEPMEEDDD